MRPFSILFLLAAGFAPAQAAGDTLTIVSWGGAYERAQRAAIFDPYAESSGNDVEVLQYDGSLTSISERAGGESWDVIDMTETLAIAACREGLIKPLEIERVVVPEPSLGLKDDFVNGAFRKCSIAQNLFATVIAFNPLAFPGIKPSRVEDLFDLSTFPGKRALPKTPDALLEWALLAEGAPAEQVYNLLSTDRGLDLAFRKLSEIRDHIVWWEDIEDSVTLIGDGSAAMATGFNGRFFSASEFDGLPIHIIWDGQQIGLEVWAIAAQSDMTDLAETFIGFATGPDRQARLAEIIPYAPARRSGMLRVGINPELRINMRDYLPTAVGNSQRRVLIQDGEWYANTRELRARRFQDWLTGEGN